MLKLFLKQWEVLNETPDTCNMSSYFTALETHIHIYLKYFSAFIKQTQKCTIHTSITQSKQGHIISGVDDMGHASQS